MSLKIKMQRWLTALKVELICLNEFYYFIRRHRRYLFTFIGLYAYSLKGWSRSRMARAGYCLTQHIDDVLDGDREISIDPITYVTDLITQIETEQYKVNWPMGCLTQAVFNDAKKYGLDVAQLQSDLIALCRVLIIDCERLTGRLLFSSEALAHHHYQTFYYSINLTLLMAEAEIRADDVPELIGAFSWCSPIRDLAEDLQKGLINIPQDVMEQAIIEGANPIYYEQVLKTPAVKAWLKTEYARGQACLSAFTDKFEALKGRRGAKLVYLFYYELKKYADKYKLIDGPSTTLRTD